MCELMAVPATGSKNGVPIGVGSCTCSSIVSTRSFTAALDSSSLTRSMPFASPAGLDFCVGRPHKSLCHFGLDCIYQVTVSLYGMLCGVRLECYGRAEAAGTGPMSLSTRVPADRAAAHDWRIYIIGMQRLLTQQRRTRPCVSQF